MPLELIDSHAHLAHPAFAEDRPEVLLRARRAGLVGILCLPSSVDDQEQTLALAESESDVWATQGIHGHEAARYSPEEEERLIRVLALRRVVALGEIGLDFHYDFSPRPRQIEVFRRQLHLAERVGLPVVIHVRAAFPEFWASLEAEGLPSEGGVVHCFSGGVDEARRVLDAGLHVSVTGGVTFRNWKEMQSVAAYVPLDRLMVETDCPYMAPVPHRGKRSEPAHVLEVAAEIGRLRGLPIEEVAVATTQSARRLFRLGWTDETASGTYP